MFSYLTVIGILYAIFLILRRQDRAARRAFAGRLDALYRARGEFWRLRVGAQEARDRGEAESAARLTEQAAALLPGITGESAALRLAYPRYAGELGWTAGVLDDELGEMGRALAAAELQDCDRWITGRGRPPVESILAPPVTMEEDALSARVHTIIGVAVGAAGGFAAWLSDYRDARTVPLLALAVYVAIGAAVLGYVARAMKDRLWTGLFGGFRDPW